MQYNGNKPTVVAYGSRALTAVEQRYRSHSEREVHAVVYGAPFSHLFTELKISPIEVHISAIQL